MYMFNTEEIFSVCVLIEDKNTNKILVVSRKTDHNDFGLPGGKIDKGETPEEAIVREVIEETGLKLTHLEFKFVEPCIDKSGMRLCAVFSANAEGVINHNEPHVVKWADPSVVLTGSFGDFNKKTFNLLNIKYY